MNDNTPADSAPRRIAPQRTIDLRCERDGLKMAEVKSGHLILRAKHHGETHFHIVALRDLIAADEAEERAQS